jgi:hypothetical protein
MISMYCRAQHGNGALCPDCAELNEYAMERLAKCPFQEGKTTCARCPVHCYRPEMREKIREVMRYAGPRMTYRHPVKAAIHLIHGRRREPLKPDRGREEG